MEITYDLQQIDTVAQQVIKHSQSKILLFYGNMGAGKTTLIKAIAKQLGISDKTSSPSFALVNEYGDTCTMYHFDFYRIKHEAEAYDIGFEDYLTTDAWICIEWPEKISNLLPQIYTELKINLRTDFLRTLVLKNQN